MSFFLPKQNTVIPLPSADDECGEMARLEEKEIIKLVKSGEIKLADMTISERDRYRKHEKSYGE